MPVNKYVGGSEHAERTCVHFITWTNHDSMARRVLGTDDRVIDSSSEPGKIIPRSPVVPPQKVFGPSKPSPYTF